MRDGRIVQQGAPLADTTSHTTPSSPALSLPADEPLPGQRDVRNGQPASPAARCGFRWPNAGIRRWRARRCPVDCRPAPAGCSAAGCAWRAGNGKHYGGDGESTLLHLDWQGFPVHVQVAGRVAVAAQQTLGLTLRCEACICLMPPAASGWRRRVRAKGAGSSSVGRAPGEVVFGATPFPLCWRRAGRSGKCATTLGPACGCG